MKRKTSYGMSLLGCFLALIAGCSTDSRGLTRFQEAWESAANAVVETVRASYSLLRKAAIPSESRRLIGMSMVSLSYELSSERWITFRVPVAGERIKVVTNACIPAGGREDPDAKWSYSLNYELMDASSDRIIKRGTYHYRTKLTRFEPKDAGLKFRYTAAFFLDEELTPTDGRFTVLNMRDFGTAKKPLVVRFRLNSMDPEIRSVVLRLYNLEPTSEFRIERMWLRITPRQKERLAMGNVYPPDLLSEQEKRNITSKLWMPVAPAGIAGRDYLDRKIYVIKDIEGSPVEEPIMPAGIYVDERLAGTMPIPEGGKRLRLTIASLEQNSSPSLGDVSLRWYGPTLADRRSLSFAGSKPTETRELFFQGGLLEITGREPVTVRAAWPEDGSEIDAVPENLYTRTYVLHGESDVKYAQFHVNGKSTPFRADFRILSQVRIGRQYDVGFTFFDERLRALRSGALDFTAYPSRYDRAVLGFDQILVSDPVSFFFDVPAKAASVTFRSADPVLVNAYTRPPDLVKKTRVPEDFYREIPSSPEREPLWFSVLPENHKALIRESRSVLLRTQLRPPEDDRDVLAGRFFWEAFRPTGSWSGQHILTPQDQDIPYQRQEALLTGCVRLSTEEPHELDIRSDQGLDAVRPILVFLGPEETVPFNIALTVDGDQFYESEVTESRGIIRLPALQAGRHLVTIRAPKDCTLLMNSVASFKPQHMLRFGCLLTKLGLNVEYVKRSDGDETLSMVFFPPFGETRRTAVRVRLRAHVSSRSGPLQGFTVLDRRFTVRPSGLGPFPVMNSPTENVDGGRSLFFPIHGDIPAGRYEVRVDLEEGVSGYVVFSSILPGTHEERLLREEAVLLQDTVRRCGYDRELP